MKNGNIRKIIVSIICVISLIYQASYAQVIDKIIVFGDSLCDTGNIAALTTAAHKTFPLIPIIPKNPPYYNGRFSNGPIWIDYLAEYMNVEQVNYAYGGSWAEPILDSKFTVPFGLGMQVDFYLVSSVLDFHKDRHLYIIWSGANDYINGRSDPEYATTNTIANIQSQMDWLVHYGAKNILVLNVPDLGVTPEVAARGPDFAAAISKLSQLHNKKFAAMIQKEKEKNPDVNIVFADVTQYFSDIIASPEKYHLKNVTEACYDGGYWLKRNALNVKELQAAKEANIDILNSPSLKTAYETTLLFTVGEQSCANPDEYLFWDHIHPSNAVHKIISEMALNLLKESGINS